MKKQNIPHLSNKRVFRSGEHSYFNLRLMHVKRKRVSAVLLFLWMCALSGCLNGQLEEIVIYEDDFENSSPNAIIPPENGFIQFGKIDSYQGSNVMGRYGTGGFFINLFELPPHDQLRITFDLYIHDGWEGNRPSVDGGEDVFILNLNRSLIYFSSIINTQCLGFDCGTIQSFPNFLGTDNPENAGVADPNLPGVCLFAGEAGGTKRFRIDRVLPHSSEDVVLQIGADIKNAGEDLCNKSWSIDNIKITSIRIPDL